MAMNHTISRRRLVGKRDVLRMRYQSELARADEQQELHESELVEHATEMWEARLLSSLGEVDGLQMRKIVQAIDLIDNGDYAICADCGCVIAERRLQALPTATSCIACAKRIRA